jgi:hypothetical protein
MLRSFSFTCSHEMFRLYLIDSPVVHAENLCFKREGVQSLIKDVFLPWLNSFRFFEQNATSFAKVGFMFSQDDYFIPHLSRLPGKNFPSAKVSFAALTILWTSGFWQMLSLSSNLCMRKCEVLFSLILLFLLSFPQFSVSIVHCCPSVVEVH